MGIVRIITVPVLYCPSCPLHTEINIIIIIIIIILEVFYSGGMTFMIHLVSSLELFGTGPHTPDFSKDNFGPHDQKYYVY